MKHDQEISKKKSTRAETDSFDRFADGIEDGAGGAVARGEGRRVLKYTGETGDGKG